MKFLVLSFVGILAISGCSEQNYGFGLGDPRRNGPDPDPNPDTTVCDGSGLCVASFDQGYASKVDILWVIDSSGSMGNDQGNLAGGAGNFETQLTNPNTNPPIAVDYRMGIISTGASKMSELKMSTYHSRSSCGIGSNYLTRNNAGRFGDCAVLGDNGASGEEGIEASRRALDPSFIGSDSSWNLNRNFIRSEADSLVVIYVSDEEDESLASSFLGQTVGNVLITQAMVDQLLGELSIQDDSRPRDTLEAYFPLLSNHRAFFQGLMSGKRFSAHAIVKTDSSCDSGSEIGQHYMDFADLTGGTQSSLCGNWVNTLSNLGLQASGLRDSFPLDPIPTDPSSISVVVTLNGNPLSLSWSYIASANVVRFSTYPPVGAHIVITYR